MRVKVKQMRVSSTIKQLDCNTPSDAKKLWGDSLVSPAVQKAIDLSIESHKLRKRY